MSGIISPRLPEKASLEQLKKQAKELAALDSGKTLALAQHELAQSYGFASWPKLKLAVEMARLRRLIQDGAVEPVDALLNASPRLAKERFAEGDTPLHVAAEENRPEIVSLIHRYGGALDARYADSAHSPLSWALTCWSFAFAERLMELGVVPDLFCAAGLGRLDLVQGFWSEGKLQANPSKTGSSRTTESWERLPCPPESDLDQVSDALYIACRASRFDVAKWLVEHGADPNFRGYIGASCLAWAEFSENPDLVRLLRANGGTDDVRDYAFRASPVQFPPMVLAGWGFRDRLAERLKRFPEEVHVETPFGTPLHAAAHHGHEWVIRLLLACGADKGRLNSAGQIAIEVAEARGHTDLLELLR